MIIKRWNVQKELPSRLLKYTIDITNHSYEDGHSVTVTAEGCPLLRATDITRQEAEGHAQSFITSLASEGFTITPGETP